MHRTAFQRLSKFAQPVGIFTRVNSSPAFVASFLKSDVASKARLSTRTRSKPAGEFYNREINRMVRRAATRLFVLSQNSRALFQYDEGECRPIPAFLEDNQPEGWQLPPEENHMCIPQFVNYEAYGLSPPMSPFICDTRGSFYLCECGGKHYLLHDPNYDIWRIEEPKDLESIVQALPDLRTEDASGSLGSEIPLILKKALKLTQLEFDESKRDL